MKNRALILILFAFLVCSVCYAAGFRREDADITLGQYSLIATEKSSDPETPASDEICFYAKDDGTGTTAYYTKDSAGTVSKVSTT